MSEVLRFDLLANDKASAVFDKLGKSVSDTESGFSKFGTKLATFGKAAAAGGLAAIGAGVALKKGLIDPASDLSETINKTTVVFGKNAAGIISWSKSSASSFGLLPDGRTRRRGAVRRHVHSARLHREGRRVHVEEPRQDRGRPRLVP
jgi:hypothetical protein